jgi:hypothetical protein
MLEFSAKVSDVLIEIKELLISKNEKYGNSALEPLGVFSQLSAKEGLLIRIDDKLKRIKNGSLDHDDEDVINDLIGYLVLLKIHATDASKYDELDGSHNWQSVKEKQEMIRLFKANLKDSL